MKYVKLSHGLKENSPVHVSLKTPEIVQNTSVSGGDGYNSYILTVENHSGTHVDAPNHFLDNGKKISDYKTEELIFKNPLILDSPKDSDELIELRDILKTKLDGVDCLFFRTGFETFRGKHPEKYLTQNPGVSPQVVHWLRKNFPEVRCLGIDTVSISGYNRHESGIEAHINAFKDDEELGKPILLIEDMKLSNIKNEDLDWVMVIPWQIKGIDSAPCTVITKLL